MKRIRIGMWLSIRYYTHCHNQNNKTNKLNPQISEKQLVDHIQRKSKKKPKFLEIPQPKGECPKVAYVQMETLKEAEKVIDKVRMTELEGQKMWAQKCREKGIAVQSMKTYSLSIGWFAEKVDKEDVYEFVGKAVDERPLRIHFVNRGQDPNIAAMLTFSESDIVAQCISKLNGKKLGGVKVEVNTAKFDDQKTSSTEIKMDNLSRKVTEQHILNHFRKYSKISNPPTSISLRHHPSDEDKMGFALIEMASHEDSLKVIQNVTMTELKGRKCFVEIWFKQSNPRILKEGRRGKTMRVRLSNLHYKMGVDEVTALCKEFGATKSVKVMSDRKGYPHCAA